MKQGLKRRRRRRRTPTEDRYSEGKTKEKKNAY